MKIFIIQPRVSYFVGGSEKISLIHADLLCRLGHNIEILTTRHPKNETSFLFKNFLSDNFKMVRYFDIPKNFFYLYDIIPGMDENRWKTESFLFNSLIFDYIKKNKPDIILSYYLPDSLLKPQDIKNVIYLCGYPRFKIDMYESFLRLCDGVISISNVVKEKWQDQIGIKKCNYVCNTGVFPPDNVIMKNSPYKKNVVFAGRLIERKGVVELIKAFAKLTNIHNDIHLWILGSGPMESYLISEIKKNKIKDKVTFTGTVEDPLSYFKMASVCVFPSHDKDGLMGVVLEAMSVGSVVITTFGSGSEDVVEHKINGFLIEPRKEDAIYDAVNFLLNDSCFSKRIGIKAKKYIKDKMLWQQKIKEFELQLFKILKS